MPEMRLMVYLFLLRIYACVYGCWLSLFSFLIETLLSFIYFSPHPQLINYSSKRKYPISFQALPVDARAGKVPPEEIVLVIRPGNYAYSSSSKTLDQKYIIKSNLEMSVEVNFRGNAEDLQNVHHIFSVRVRPKSLKGIQGLYVFPLKCKLPGIFRSAGVYTFSFHLVSNI